MEDQSKTRPTSGLLDMLLTVGIRLLEAKYTSTIPVAGRNAVDLEGQIRSANYNAEALRNASGAGLAGVQGAFMKGLK
jgi:hypothetical protein